METKTRAQQFAEMLKSMQRTENGGTVSKASSGEQAKQILVMRFIHEMTLDQVAQSMGLTRERVRQIESKAIQEIRSRDDLRGRTQGVLED